MNLSLGDFAARPLPSAAVFDATAPLPTGLTVLEASAGTGKTFAIVGLAARYLAEGVIDIRQLLLVTFSRASSRELRERARDRLVRTAQALADPHTATHSEDPIVAQLASGAAAEVAARRARLAHALANYDAATITTIHDFCQRMLITLGMAGHLETGTTLVSEVSELIDEAATDRYLAAYAGSVEQPPLWPGFLEAARAAVRDRNAVIQPTELDPAHRNRLSWTHARFGAAIRDEVRKRKTLGRIRDYDDVQDVLDDALTDPLSGPAAAHRLRQLYRVVLVDEFQDTDPIQWRILQTAFGPRVSGPPELAPPKIGATELEADATRAMVLVGDPKQAIYGFRGAEVSSYLQAVTTADAQLALDKNWRSDATVVSGLDTIFRGAALGHTDIVVNTVLAQHNNRKLTGSAAVRLRVMDRNNVPLSQSGKPLAPGMRTKVADDVAADVAALLNSEATYEGSDGPRAVTPGDIAILVPTNKLVVAVRESLDAVGVPSVATRGESVFATAAATDFARVLAALAQPGYAGAVRLAGLTTLIGYTAADLATRGEDLVAELGTALRDLTRVFTASGFAAMFERLASAFTLEARLIGTEGGERMMTDIRHIAELAHHASIEHGYGLTALARWLTENINDPNPLRTDEPHRRLDTDAAAVQVLTLHYSKGLEFPVVYLPFGWQRTQLPNQAANVYHNADGHRVLDLTVEDEPGWTQARALADSERGGEDLRTLYVGATRAASQLVLWWAPSTVTAGSALHRLLFGGHVGGAIPPETVSVPSDEAAWDTLVTRFSGTTVQVERCERREAQPWLPPQTPHVDIACAAFTRSLDAGWRRTSYSGLIAGAVHTSTLQPAIAIGAPDVDVPAFDEPTDPPTTLATGLIGTSPNDSHGGTATEPGASAMPSLLNEFRGGAAFGSLVHDILEHVDTDAPDLRAAVSQAVADAAGHSPKMTGKQPALVDALLAVLATPLGTVGPLAGVTLDSVSPADRLAELDFELPLAGGDHRVGSAAGITLSELARLYDRYVSADDVLAGYSERLRELPHAELRGYLTGSIDVIIRVKGCPPEGADQYVVVDYKTNRLAIGDLTTADYTASAMAQEMINSHYVLQALLYSVALHRYLRWRVSDYDPTVHLGPVQYHFVRAMVGPETPDGCGVFEWSPPTELILAVSDALRDGVLGG